MREAITDAFLSTYDITGSSQQIHVKSGTRIAVDMVGLREPYSITQASIRND